MRPIALLLIPVLLLAGCASDAPAAAVDEVAPAEAPVGAAIDGTPLHAARFATGTLVDETRWLNGTFKLEKASRLVDGVPRAPVEQEGTIIVTDITDMVPLGVPSRIFAAIESDMMHGDLDLWLRVPSGEWRTMLSTSPYGGSSSFEVGMVHEAAEPVQLVLAYDVAEPAAEHAYTLSVRVVSDPDLLLSGVATGLTLPADARLEIELVGEKRERAEIVATSLMVFAPDDTYLGAFPLAAGATSITLPAGSPAGEYALLLSQGGRHARVLVHGAPAPMRALPMEWVNGDPVELDAQGRATWTMETARTPLLAGVFFSSPNAARDVDFSLDGPAGPLLDGRLEGIWFAGEAGPVAFATGFGWDSLYGAPGLGPGTYTANVAFGAAAGAQPGVAAIFAAYHSR